MDYYSILGVDKSASQNEIKKAYHKLAIKHHPDKGGDPDEFKKITEAYETLSDPVKRQEYDNPAPSMDNIFDHFNHFSPFSHFKHQQQQEKDYISNISIRYTLEQAYTGSSAKINCNIKRSCPDCNGTGSANKQTTTCPSCEGRGMNVIRRGNTVIQTTCNRCRGNGFIISNPCKKCNGTKKIFTDASITVDIPMGVHDGEQRTFNTEYGPINIIYKEREHDKFKREGNNLICICDIQLSESLCGFTKIIDLFGKDSVCIQTKEIIKQDEIRCVKGKGIMDGDLIIKFNVIYPVNIDTEKIKNVLEYPEQPEITGIVYDLEKYEVHNQSNGHSEYYTEQQCTPM